MSSVLFLPRLYDIARSSKLPKVTLNLFITGSGNLHQTPQGAFSVYQRRIAHEDLLAAIGDLPTRQSAVCYVCGVPQMTDDFVYFLQQQEGMDHQRVLCEKWW